MALKRHFEQRPAHIALHPILPKAGHHIQAANQYAPEVAVPAVGNPLAHQQICRQSPGAAFCIDDDGQSFATGPHAAGSLELKWSLLFDDALVRIGLG